MIFTYAFLIHFLFKVIGKGNWFPKIEAMFKELYQDEFGLVKSRITDELRVLI